MRFRTVCRTVTVTLASILLGVLAHPALAVTDLDSSPFILRGSLSIAPDQYSGAFTYSYPITVPPGRNGMQPTLSLSYTSGDANASSLVGYGWSLSIPTIERINRYGTDDLYTRHDFTSSLSGELEDVSLSDGLHGTYGAKVDDGGYLSYTYNTNDTWTVTDKLGTDYTFGGSTTAQVVDSADATHIYRWYLTEIRDNNGNTVTYAYTKYGGQVYPSNINYTGNGTASGIFDVAFALESRSDALTSYAAGFAVTTSYRIDSISVKVNSTTVRSVDLGHSAGDNGVRSLLTSITETGYEGATSVIKPTTTFTYETSDRSWTEQTSFTFPLAIGNTSGGSLGVYFFDVNGDALTDVVESRDSTRAVYINNGNNTFTQDTSISVPVAFTTSGYDNGVRVADVDGDGFLDLVRAYYDGTSSQSSVYWNNGGTGWTQDTAVTVPRTFTGGSGGDSGVRLFDVDGDGLPDVVYARYESGGTLDEAVYINDGDGTGWTEDTGYTVPTAFAGASEIDTGTRMFDVNGDGLTDLVHAHSESGVVVDVVYLNEGDGTGWVEDAAYSVPLAFASSSGRDTSLRETDLTGDGIIDLTAARTDATGNLESWVYTGDSDTSGWTQDTGASVPIALTGSVRQVDIDGDMLDDILYSHYEGSTWTDRLFLADGNRADVLTGIESSQGGTTSVTYTTTPVGGNNDGLWFPMHVVSTVTTNDGFGNTAATSYTYADGDYYYASEYDRKFAGFGTVTATDATGNYTKTYYHQGNSTNSTQGESTDDASKIGRAYREEIYSASNQLYRTTITSWTNYDLGNDRDFVYQSQSLELLYDVDSDHRDKATTFTFDTASGNLTEKKDWGLVTGTDSGSFTDTGTDIARVNWTYATWTTGGTSAYPSEEILRDQYSNRWRHTLWYYDSLTFGSVSTGNRTEESGWVSGSTVIDTTYTYSSYGLVATITDPRGNVTTYTPDAYNLYPATVTDALSHDTDYVYDYSSGKVTSMTDANGFVFETDYDGFDRPTAEWQPDGATPTTLVAKKAYVYDDTSLPSSVHETVYLDSSTQREIYTYLDGFGRVIQRREEAEGTNTYNVTDTTYDELGRLESASLPYASTGSARTTATTNTALYETLAYDALGRVTSTSNAAGTHTKSYEDWWVTEVDANGETKLYYYDAYNMLTTVGERLGTSTTYTTSYTWTTGGDLAKITDGAGNIRQFSFDNLGRRTVARDLRAATDSEYGTWSFTYDNASNMATSVSPLGVTTTYTYDDANRVTAEDASSGSGTEVTYTYDTCTNGVGRLCSVAVASGATTVYTYDALGRVATEAKTISGTTYTTSYEYDRQGNIANVTYPDTSELYYGLDNAGGIDAVYFDDVHVTPVETIASSIAYGPHGKVTSATYSNGVTSTWAYDAAELYRLTDLVTTVGTTDLEDFTYGYDNVGNITSLVDASDLYADMTLSYGYDDLYRITSAASSSTDSALTYSKTWTYGAIGNILTSTDCGTYSYFGYQSGNYANPHAVTSVCGKTYIYDRNGNVTSDGTWANTWNSRNEMTQSVSGATTVTYQYDHEGNRVKQSNGTTTTVYPNGYYDVEGSDVRRHLLAGALGSVATSTWDGTDSDIVYHHKDHLGGTHVETDESGAVLEYLIYKPFGDSLVDSKSGTYENDRKFTGKEKDSTTGYYYYGARYYKADIGRFLSQDPVYLGIGAHNFFVLTDPQSLNSYAYVRNNPLTNIDPDGRFWKQVTNFFAGAINAWLTNNVAGVGRQTTSDKYFQHGQQVGDVASAVQSAIEIGVGMTGSAASIAVSSTGVGAIAGTPAAVASALLVSHGATVGASAIANFSAGQGSGSQSAENWTANIANGHAYEKHVVERREFNDISNPEEFLDHVMDVVNNPTKTKSLENGRTGYWQESSGTVVIHDPSNADSGTAFRPNGGEAYFNRLK